MFGLDALASGAVLMKDKFLSRTRNQGRRCHYRQRHDLRDHQRRRHCLRVESR